MIIIHDNNENKIDDDKVFGFTDEFDQVELNVSDNLDYKIDSLLENVRSVSEHNNFKILQILQIFLNINSIFNKFEHVFSLLNELNELNFDVIALNSLYQHP